jgi:hypothetical protein
LIDHNWDNINQLYLDLTDLALKLINTYDVELLYPILRKLNKNEYLRSENTKKLNKESKQKIINMLEVIINKTKVNLDENISESSESWITRGMNSVKWISIELVSVMLFFFTKDKKLKDILLTESYPDQSQTIRSTIVNNSIYLIKENRKLCCKIYEKLGIYKNRNKYVDFALIRTMYRFWKHLEEKKIINLFKRILENSKDEQVQKDIWTLLWQLVVHEDNEYTEIFDLLLKWELSNLISYKEASKNICQRWLSKIQWADEKYQDKIIHYFKAIYTAEESSTRSLLLPFHEDLAPQTIILFLQKWIFKIIIDHIDDNIDMYRFSEYLERCLIEWKSLEKEVIEVLKIIHSNDKASLYWYSEHLSSKEFANIYSILLKSNDVNFNEIRELFDFALKYGNEDIYAVFESLILKK